MGSPLYKHGRTHGRRGSTMRLSTDTTHTLPEYIPAGWSKPDDVPSDLPPDYPDSAEEADADTDEFDSDRNPAYVHPPPHSPPPSQRRARRGFTHKRRPSAASSSDGYLDTLLERSVHALEISNSLLRSSMSTRTTLSAIIASDTPADRELEDRVKDLSMRIKDSELQDLWRDDLGKISEDIDEFVEQKPMRAGQPPLSVSLPTSGPLHVKRRPRRHPSLDMCRDTASGSPRLCFSPSKRDRFVSPAPRAVTAYIDTGADPNEIYLPPTLGVRVPPSRWKAPAGASSPTLSGDSCTRSSAATHEGTAYNSLKLYSSSFGSISTPSFLNWKPYPRGTSPKRREPPLTPQPEELSPASSSSSGSGTRPLAKHTIQSLRKILDEQSAQGANAHRRRPLALIPAPPVPLLETSTATASISRLFTKAIHTSSTRARSPPRQSSMKLNSPQRSGTTPLSPIARTTSSGADTGASASSGRSTPKRITFAALPEPYSRSRPLGGPSYFKGVGGKWGQGRGKGKEKSEGEGESRSTGGDDDRGRDDGTEDGDGEGEGDAVKSGWFAWLVRAARDSDAALPVDAGPLRAPRAWESANNLEHWGV